jgi:quinol monooxygenase YgiN
VKYGPGVGQFGQHTTLIARTGRREALVAKFLEAASLQRANEACLLMIVGTPGDDDRAVTLTEVWTSGDDHRRATESSAIQAWAAEMPELVDHLESSRSFIPVGGKGLEMPHPT